MESFNVSINYPLKSRNLAGCCDKANVTIVDSDGMYVSTVDMYMNRGCTESTV